VADMPKMIQIRNVPDDLHGKLKARAAQRGLSLSDYLLRMAEREADTLSIEELTERIRRRGPVKRGVSAADIIREMRGPIS
jgi:plasmid stability protein